MKKWEKPMIQNLNLNQTQEEEIDPLALPWNSVYKCTKCEQTYDENGKSFFNQSTLIPFPIKIQNFDKLMSEWKCATCNSSITCVDWVQCS